MARRPDRRDAEVLSKEHLAELRHSLAHLSLPAVRTFYEQSYQDCRLIYAGHLFVDWGSGHRAWVQLAHRKDKPVLEIRKHLAEGPFPGFRRFVWDIDEINAVPLNWQSVLKGVKGVYLLVCKETGKHYIGSAKGEPRRTALSITTFDGIMGPIL
jgi:hypothetical protein